MVQHEDEELQALALSVMPLEAMQAEAEDSVRLNEQLGDAPDLAWCGTLGAGIPAKAI